MNSFRRSKLLFLPPLILISVFASLFLLTESVTKTTPKAHHHHLHVQNHFQTARSTCQGTLHPDLCVSTLSKFPDFQKKSVADIISATVNLTINLVHSSASSCKSIRNHLHAVPLIQRRAIDDCLELLSETVDELKSGVSDLSSVQKGSHSRYSDIQTLLSGAMTNQDTCLDGFAQASNKTLRKIIQPGLVNISHHVSNSLALLKKIAPVASRPTYYEMDGDGFPRWLSRKDRRLLQEAGDGTTLNYDLVVAKDGTGNFTTIGEAVEAAPNRSEVRFVIYIKAGAYFENVEVISQKTMLMFVGDGIGKTLVKAGRNVVDGWTTFNSATVAVVGYGFIAKGITFENYAGPSKHQAVALRSNSDRSAFYNCSFVAYQDTLYVHSLRQFYRDCDIYGTIDFVFGNAAAVLQNCNLYARRPNPGQSNVFTAQGRSDPNENTGISILNCKVAAAEDLIPVVSEFRNYLGRPWKEYSRTVYLLSHIDGLIDPAGWLKWDGDFALATLYYGEYKNRGPGANTSARVTWPGYRVINSSTEANEFTVGSFIEGGEWLPPTGIPFYLGLSSLKEVEFLIR